MLSSDTCLGIYCNKNLSLVGVAKTLQKKAQKQRAGTGDSGPLGPPPQLKLKNLSWIIILLLSKWWSRTECLCVSLFSLSLPGCGWPGEGGGFV